MRKTKDDLEREKRYEKLLAEQNAVNESFKDSEDHCVYGFPVCLKCGALINNTWTDKITHYKWHNSL